MVDKTALNPIDPDSGRSLHRQIDAETRDELRDLREEVAELKVQLQIERDYRSQHEQTMSTMTTLVHAGIGVRYIVVAMIAMLSMIGGISVAHETLKKWFSH